MKQKEPDIRLNRREALLAIPIRNPSLKYDTTAAGVVRVKVERQRQWYIWLLSKLFFIPKERQVELDAIGSRVWELCDGEHTVEDLIEDLVVTQQITRREAELSMTRYLRTLAERGIIGFLVREEEGPGTKEEQ